ncbi:MAG: acyl-CoA dehydratase activase [Thermodesulfobacteriota bacterium]|nr:acyl-CoA dehydratase activase [Thermodesulfobacteriota bacterium]
MVIIGLDVGSRSIELVMMEGEEITLQQREDTTYNPLAQCNKMLDGLSWDHLVVTGYGRKLLAQHFPAREITEIQAYALGTRRLFPGGRAILDIGGQDTKAISLSPAGGVRKFEMNDRCAAGTGKFLEFMAVSLSRPLDDFGTFALRGAPGIAINSMCTVFAETEATSLMARGCRPEDIALALHMTVVSRSVSMLRRVGSEGPVIFAGGVARNPCLVKLIRDALEGEVLIPKEPDLVGALGAALYGFQNPV